MDAVIEDGRPTFAEINRQARVYPDHLLPKGGSALALFSAAFYGWNDVIHFARKGMHCVCVDTDMETLAEMREIYPDGWDFVVGDAWEYAEAALAQGMRWDVVSVDPFLGDAAERAWDTLYLWTSLAQELVTLTVKADTRLNAPDGWTVSYWPRSSNAAWMVLNRA